MNNTIVILVTITYIICLVLSLGTFLEGLLSTPYDITSIGLGGGLFILLSILPKTIDLIDKYNTHKKDDE